MRHHQGLVVWGAMVVVMVGVCLHYQVSVLTLCICFIAWYGGVVSTWAGQQELKNYKARKLRTVETPGGPHG